MAIETTRVTGQQPVDPTATPIDTDRRRDRRDKSAKPKAARVAAPVDDEDDTVTIAPAGAKIDVRA
jgi:hypothetical protein